LGFVACFCGGGEDGCKAIVCKKYGILCKASFLLAKKAKKKDRWEVRRNYFAKKCYKVLSFNKFGVILPTVEKISAVFIIIL
jgi:hypothetical protein